MNKWIPEQPGPWRKSSKRESCNGDRVYGAEAELFDAGLPPARPAAKAADPQQTATILLLLLLLRLRPRIQDIEKSWSQSYTGMTIGHRLFCEEFL